MLCSNAEMAGFIFTFSVDDYANLQTRIETEEEGVLPCMEELVFAPASAKVVSFEKGGRQI